MIEMSTLHQPVDRELRNEWSNKPSKMPVSAFTYFAHLKKRTLALLLEHENRYVTILPKQTLIVRLAK